MDKLQVSLTRNRVLGLVLLAVVVAVLALGIYGYLYYRCGVGGPCPLIGGLQESVSLTNYTIDTSPGQQNPSVLTLWLWNTGYDTARLSSLSVSDVWGGAPVSFPVSISIPSQATATVTVDTSSSGFYFTSNHEYSVRVTTSGGQYTYHLSYP